MRYFVILFVIGLSCTEEASNDATSGQKKTVQSGEEIISDPNKQFSANVEGMVCKMGCAASIRKELTALKGVSEVEIDFIEDRVKQIVQISYNDKNIDKTVIQNTIESINNNQFRVTEARTEVLND